MSTLVQVTVGIEVVRVGKITGNVIGGYDSGVYGRSWGTNVRGACVAKVFRKPALVADFDNIVRVTVEVQGGCAVAGAECGEVQGIAVAGACFVRGIGGVVVRGCRGQTCQRLDIRAACRASCGVRCTGQQCRGAILKARSADNPTACAIDGTAERGRGLARIRHRKGGNRGIRYGRKAQRGPFRPSHDGFDEGAVVVGGSFGEAREGFEQRVRGAGDVEDRRVGEVAVFGEDEAGGVHLGAACVVGRTDAGGGGGDGGCSGRGNRCGIKELVEQVAEQIEEGVELGLDGLLPRGGVVAIRRSLHEDVGGVVCQIAHLRVQDLPRHDAVGVDDAGKAGLPGHVEAIREQPRSLHLERIGKRGHARDGEGSGECRRTADVGGSVDVERPVDLGAAQRRSAGHVERAGQGRSARHMQRIAEQRGRCHVQRVVQGRLAGYCQGACEGRRTAGIERAADVCISVHVERPVDGGSVEGGGSVDVEVSIDIGVVVHMQGVAQRDQTCDGEGAGEGGRAGGGEGSTDGGVSGHGERAGQGRAAHHMQRVAEQRRRCHVQRVVQGRLPVHFERAFEGRRAVHVEEGVEVHVADHVHGVPEGGHTGYMQPGSEAHGIDHAQGVAEDHCSCDEQRIAERHDIAHDEASGDGGIFVEDEAVRGDRSGRGDLAEAEGGVSEEIHVHAGAGAVREDVGPGQGVDLVLQVGGLREKGVEVAAEQVGVDFQEDLRAVAVLHHCAGLRLGELDGPPAGEQEGEDAKGGRLYRVRKAGRIAV